MPFGIDIDYAMLIKQYGSPIGQNTAGRYSPVECVGAVKTPVTGKPNADHISTSYVERANLSMRMACAASCA